MTRLAPVILAAGLMLGGCEGVLGGFGGALVTTLGGGAVESIEAKKTAILKWRLEKTRLVLKVTDRMETYAAKLFAAGKEKEGIAMLREIITFHDEQQPLWLIQKYIRRKQAE